MTGPHLVIYSLGFFFKFFYYIYLFIHFLITFFTKEEYQKELFHLAYLESLQ